ncbi:unnamed protein product [Arctia plantaginis]|uniref:Uncharacterized protein n=1 Tax=Arctia plantaginis TaxID=874455 RepID=A0A8S1BCP2_ARCPL|nr:unnamed protein product [Arctia plantaginis]CAB3255597.1 unnamed protein product [Arctia plantaginis]
MFKVVIFYCIIAMYLNNALAITDEQQAQIHSKVLEFSSECIKDHPVAIEDLSSLKQEVFPEGSAAGCFAACVFNKIGLFDEKGNLSPTTALEHAKNIFKDEKELKSIEEFLATCVKVNDEEVSDGELGCERAKLAFNCYVENYKKFDFHFIL